MRFWCIFLSDCKMGTNEFFGQIPLKKINLLKVRKKDRHLKNFCSIKTPASLHQSPQSHPHLFFFYLWCSLFFSWCPDDYLLTGLFVTDVVFWCADFIQTVGWGGGEGGGGCLCRNVRRGAGPLGPGTRLNLSLRCVPSVFPPRTCWRSTWSFFSSFSHQRRRNN